MKKLDRVQIQKPSRKGPRKQVPGTGMSAPKTVNRYAISEVRDAITEAGGVLSVAARILGCHRSTVESYIRRYPDDLGALRGEGLEIRLDEAENKLREHIVAGRERSLIFFLKTRGKKRGYVERVEHDHSGVLESADPKTRRLVREVQDRIKGMDFGSIASLLSKKGTNAATEPEKATATADG